MKKKLSILAVLLLAVVTTAYSVSGTYAKYTSTFNGTSDTARVAKWAFEIDENAIVNNAFEFDLFETIMDSNGTAEETNIESQNSDIVIAPGTSGKAEIKLANVSEVDAEYTVDFGFVNNGGIPVEFHTGNGDWSSDINELDTTATINKKSGEATITIQWRWPFESATGSDAADTALGLVGKAELKIKADVTVTQVD